MSRLISYPQQSRLGDIKIAWKLLTTRATGDDHVDRLESFYKGQAAGYDSFRSRLLHGRDELFSALPADSNTTWIDLGAGTGENADRIGDRVDKLKQLYLVDLCPSLLEVARRRVAERGWTNVSVCEADATSFDAGVQADVVTLSYSLTMIPDWFAAIDRAFDLLKPGGHIGVVDFFAGRKHPTGTQVRHRWLTRTFWPIWFAGDNVFLNPDHIPYLSRKFETVSLDQSMGKVPFLPLARAPYYRFVGRKPLA